MQNRCFFFSLTMKATEKQFNKETHLFSRVFFTSFFSIDINVISNIDYKIRDPRFCCCYCFQQLGFHRKLAQHLHVWIWKILQPYLSHTHIVTVSHMSMFFFVWPAIVHFYVNGSWFVQKRQNETRQGTMPAQRKPRRNPSITNLLFRILSLFRFDLDVFLCLSIYVSECVCVFIVLMVQIGFLIRSSLLCATIPDSLFALVDNINSIIK